MRTSNAAWEGALDSARRVAEIAQRLGIKVGLENVENRFLLSPREWMEFLDAVGNPNSANDGTGSGDAQRSRHRLACTDAFEGGVNTHTIR